uniref:Uncharacterized protein n=1 Tax=Glossina pallidipes TaxID=7398 RepID=A0A1A9Z311_GLOPL
MIIIKSFANSLLTIEDIAIVLIIKNDYIIVSLKLPHKLNVVNSCGHVRAMHNIYTEETNGSQATPIRNELQGTQHMSIEAKAILYAATEQCTARLKEIVTASKDSTSHGAIYRENNCGRQLAKPHAGITKFLNLSKISPIIDCDIDGVALLLFFIS